MAGPESRRFGVTPPDPSQRPKIKLSSPAPAPAGKTTRKVPRTPRRTTDDAGDPAAAAAFAATETKAKDQMVLYGAIGGGGVLLLVIVIAVAASSGSSGRAREAARPAPRKAAPEPPPPPVEKPRPTNYVKNTGSIVFVCAGTEKHPDREVVLASCPKCPSRNAFAWDEAAAGYRCSSCKAVYENSAIKCDRCERPPRVTHLKKSVSAQ
jgi:hypothetical protein